MNSLDLSGQVAIVTGGAQGIGLAIVERLIESGAVVNIWDRDQDRLADAVAHVGKNAIGDIVDVTDAEAIERATCKIIEAHERIDVLVNNAGIAGEIGPVNTYPLSEWDKVISVNLTSQFLTLRAVTPFMVARGYGRVVNVASTAAKEGNPNAAAYCASKAGVIALTKSIGRELATTGVLVNCICPVIALTPLVEAIPRAQTELLLSKIPMGRFLKVEEIAAMVGWLCTQECSFSTGAAFDLSGGRATY